MKNNKKSKNTTNNVLIIVSIIFVTVAVVVFVIALSIFSSGDNQNNSGSVSISSLIEGSSSKIESSSSKNESSSYKPESSFSQPVSSSSKPVSSSSKPASSSSKPASSSSKPASSSSKPASSSSSGSSSSGGTELTQAQKLVANARLLLRAPFKSGGSDPKGFDSSGFIYYVMRESGYVSCPRDIKEQAKMGVSRKYSDLKPGDLVFFSNEVGGSPNYAGIYTGNGKMIGCLSTLKYEGVVEVSITNDYYRSHYVAGVGIS